MYSKNMISGYQGATYGSLLALLQKSSNRVHKIDRDTRIYSADNEIYVQYHDTNVLTFTPDGKVRLNDGGWLSNSTRAVMNSFLPSAYTVTSDKGKWYVSLGEQKERYHSDIVLDLVNMQILALRLTTLAQDAYNAKLVKAIKAYAALYTQDVVWGLTQRYSSTQGASASGDCWKCLMRTANTGKTWGDADHDTEHLLSHMEEEYVMVSLLLNAYDDLKDRPNGNPQMNPLFAAAYGHDAQQVITRYLKKRLLVGAVQIR